MTGFRTASCLALAFCACLLAVAPSRAAEGLTKGNSILSFELTTGTADLVGPIDGSGRISAYDHSEWGGQVQFQHLLSEDWAIAISGGVGTFKETDKPGDVSPPLTTEFKYTQSSWQARLGADRFVHISPTFHLFVGPGIQYWSGKGHLVDTGASFDEETVRAKRIALNGRMGANVSLSNSVALDGHLGHYLGLSRATAQGAKTTWTPSGFESALGFAFKF